MADEPSWDAMFPGSAADGSTANQAGAPGRRSAHGDAPTHLTRRQLRERERMAEQAAAVAESARASALEAPTVAGSTRDSASESPTPAPTRAAAAPPEVTASRVETTAPADHDHAAAAFAALAGEKTAQTTTAAAPATADAPGGQRRSSDRRARKQPRERPQRHGHRRGALILVIVLVVVLGGGTAGGYAIYTQYGPKVAALFGAKPSDDYTGSGDGKKVDFTIVQGDIGSTISAKLAKADITKSSAAPYKLLLADQNIQFQPGTYAMYQHMSAESAIARLQDASARITTKLVIPEGTTLKGIISLMSSVTKIPVAKVTAAAANYKAYGLPSNATSLEGYLFPATYDLQPGKPASFYFQQMVTTMKQHLTSAGVPEAQWEHTVIFASLVQKEAGLAADFPKVARVFQNRIDQGMLLQSDATVAYGAGTTNTVTTTDAQRADAANPYNTYVHKGLPPGPISNPGDIAIAAVTHPATGSWLYFVTVNLETGQTVFSTTYADHQRAVAQFQAWLRAHPSYQ